jgi:hypothetical protein
MKRLNFQLGDFISHKHPSEDFSLKKGIVVEAGQHSIVIHWLSYNKKFWLGDEHEEFAALNQEFLLGTMTYPRNHNPNLCLLSRAP